MLTSAYATLSSGPMTYRGPHWDDGCDLGIKTGPVGAELFEQFAQAFGAPSDAERIDPRPGNASPGRRFPYAGWQDETAGSASHCSEGAPTLIGASRNKLVFPAILQSRRRPMQKASAYGALPPLTGRCQEAESAPFPGLVTGMTDRHGWVEDACSDPYRRGSVSVRK